MDRSAWSRITVSGVPPTAAPKELLAELPTIGSSSAPKLLFSRVQPASLLERFTSWLLRPIQRIAARDQIAKLLRRAKEKDGALTHLRSVQALEGELKNSGLLRGVSARTAKAALFDITVRGFDPGPEFSLELDACIDELGIHYRGLCEAHNISTAGLDVLCNFAKQPGAPMDALEALTVTKFMESLTNSGRERPENIGATFDFKNVLSVMYERYVEAFQQYQERPIALDPERRLTPTQASARQKATDSALSALCTMLPSSAHASVQAFKDFLQTGAATTLPTTTPLLEEFIQNFGRHVSALDTESHNCLLPHVLRAAKQVYGAAFGASGDAQYRQINSHGLRQLAKAVKSSANRDDKIVQSSAHELVLYLQRTDAIRSLEEKIRAAEKRRAGLEAKKTRQLDRQNLRSLRKRQPPRTREKSATLALAGELNAASTELTALEQALADLRAARAIPLRYPLPRLLLLHAIHNAWRLRAQLDQADKAVAEAALQELVAEWRALAPDDPIVSSAAPASQSPNPAASSRSARN